MKMMKIMAMRTPMKTWQVRALEDIRMGEEVTTRYGGLNIGQVNWHSTAEKQDHCEQRLSKTMTCIHFDFYQKYQFKKLLSSLPAKTEPALTGSLGVCLLMQEVPKIFMKTLFSFLQNTVKISCSIFRNIYISQNTMNITLANSPRCRDPTEFNTFNRFRVWLSTS